MYCYQCGKKIIEGANFCHFCGADQRLVETLKDSEDQTSPQKESHPLFDNEVNKEDTKVFKLSGLSEEEDLNLILNQVDHNIKKNLEEFETSDKIRNKNISSQVELEDDSEEEAVKKNRKSFSQIWKDFINEEDNPYSVFGEISKTDPSQPKEIDESTENFVENNLTAPTDNSLETPLRNDEVKQGKAPSYFSKLKNKLMPSKIQEPQENLDDSFITELRVQEIIETPENKEAPTTENIQFNEEKGQDNILDDFSESNPEDDIVSEKSNIFSSILKKENRDDSKSSLEEKNILAFIQPAIIFISEKQKSLLHFIKTKPVYVLILVFVLGIMLCASPIFIIQKSIGLAEVVLSIFKVLIGLFTFYYANYIARRNTLSGKLNPALNIDTLLHWTMCQIVALIAFFLYPKNIVMGHDLLGALTPHFITSVLIYLFAVLLSLGSVYDKLQQKDYLEYFGWFSIVFILIELLSKLFWVILTFLSTSVL